jgi:hypothetical protein
MAMEFLSEAQKACYGRVREMLEQVFGDDVVPREDVPVFGLHMGSALAESVVYPWAEDDAVITTRAYVVRGTTVTPELMRYLLEENDKLRFGGFGLDEDGDIFFQHAIVGSTADPEELRASLLAVVITADEYDDKIIERYGGQSALDFIKEALEEMREQGVGEGETATA